MAKVGSSEWWDGFAEELGEDFDEAYKAEVAQFFNRIEQNTTNVGRQHTDWRDPVEAVKKLIQSDPPKEATDNPATRWKIITENMSEQIRGISDNLYPTNPTVYHKGSFIPIRFGELRRLVSGDSFSNPWRVVLDPGDAPGLSGGDREEIEELEKINVRLKAQNQKEVIWTNPEPAAVKFKYGAKLAHTEQDTMGIQMYFGFPKIGLLFDKTFPEKENLLASKGKSKKAAFSIMVDRVEVNNDTLTLYFKEENLEEIRKEWNTYINISRDDTSKDQHLIFIGRYVDLDESDIDGYLSNLKAGAAHHGSHALLDMGNGILDAIASSVDGVATREFYCCIFYELIRNAKVSEALSATTIDKYRIDNNNSLIVRSGYSSDEEYNEAYKNGTKASLEYILENPELSAQHIESFLAEQRVWLSQLHALLLAMLPLFSGNSLSMSWGLFQFNMVAIMHTSITIMLTTMLNIIQQELFEQAVQWGKERIEASQNPGVASRCLPWEELFMGMITALFGPNGWAKQVRELISRMQEYTMKKSKELATEEEGAASNTEQSKWLPKLNASIDMIEWLLDLNAQAFNMCAVHRQDKFEKKDSQSEDSQDSSNENASTVSTGIDRDTGSSANSPSETGDMSEATGSAFTTSGTASSLYSNLGGTSRQIDITGTEINPVSLLIEHNDEDVAKFFTQYIGLTKEEAKEALSKAKKGECLKTLKTSEVQDLKDALNNVGLDI